MGSKFKFNLQQNSVVCKLRLWVAHFFRQKSGCPPSVRCSLQLPRYLLFHMDSLCLRYATSCFTVASKDNEPLIKISKFLTMIIPSSRTTPRLIMNGHYRVLFILKWKVERTILIIVGAPGGTMGFVRLHSTSFRHKPLIGRGTLPRPNGLSPQIEDESPAAPNFPLFPLTVSASTARTR